MSKWTVHFSTMGSPASLYQVSMLRVTVPPSAMMSNPSHGMTFTPSSNETLSRVGGPYSEDGEEAAAGAATAATSASAKGSASGRMGCSSLGDDWVREAVGW